MGFFEPNLPTNFTNTSTLPLPYGHAHKSCHSRSRAHRSDHHGRDHHGRPHYHCHYCFFFNVWVLGSKPALLSRSWCGIAWDWLCALQTGGLAREFAGPAIPHSLVGDSKQGPQLPMVTLFSLVLFLLFSKQCSTGCYSGSTRRTFAPSTWESRQPSSSTTTGASVQRLTSCRALEDISFTSTDTGFRFHYERKEARKREKKRASPHVFFFSRGKE